MNDKAKSRTAAEHLYEIGRLWRANMATERCSDQEREALRSLGNYIDNIEVPEDAPAPTDFEVIKAMFARAGIDMAASTSHIEFNTPSSTADEDDDHVGPANLGDEDLTGELNFNLDGSLRAVGAWER